MSTLNFSKSRLLHSQLWGLLRNDESLEAPTLATFDTADHSADKYASLNGHTTAPPAGPQLQAAAWAANLPPIPDTEVTASDTASLPLPSDEAAVVSWESLAADSSGSPSATSGSLATSQPASLDGPLADSAGPLESDDSQSVQDVDSQDVASLADPSSGGATMGALTLAAPANNNPPTDVTLQLSQSFNENIAGAIAGTLSVTDPDAGDTHTFSVSDSRFEVVNNQLKLKDGVRLDFERESHVNLDVTATDSGGLSVTKTFDISVGDIPEIRFAAFGDYGSSSGTQKVANLVTNLNVDFIITLGDNVYGTDPIDFQIGRYYSNYIGHYTGAYGPGSPTDRFFPALGNHEYEDPAGGVNASAYLDYFTLPGNERYYDYTIGPVHFFVLDSDKHEIDGRNSTSVQAQWLQSGLASSTSPCNIVYFHHTAFSSGASIGSTAIMQWPFEQWGATAVLGAHVHNYERVMRDDNADGTLMPYFTDGLGGKSKASFSVTPVEGSAVQYNADFGAMLIQACSYSIQFDFLAVTGGGTGTLIDSYTIDFVDPTEPLFTTGNDAVDFNQVSAGSYLAGSQYDALAGDDTVTLPADTTSASSAGYDPTNPFHGGDGNDTITGGTLNDTIYGDAGDDALSGGQGNDSLDGGTGIDTVSYSAAAGGVMVDLGLGTATGGAGVDTLLNLENVTGSDFDDTLTGSTGANVMLGGAGNDILSGGGGNDTLAGGSGTDQLLGDAGHDTLKWDAADSFDGGAGFDTLDANLASADAIDLRSSSFAALERILTGDGDDTVFVGLSKILSDTADHQFVADLGAGADTLIIDANGGWTATTANPTLGPTGVAAGISVAGLNAQTFTNGTDTVTIFANAETVKLLSPSTPLFTIGNDIVDFNQITAGSYLAGSQYDALDGDDTVTLPIDTAAATAAGYDPAQAFHGGTGTDFITGGDLNDTIFGDASADTLVGGAGDDNLNGGGSGDTLIGGPGNDLLDGGTGSSIDDVDYSAAAGAVAVDLASGTATGEGNDTILNIENVTGSGFDDSLTGDSANNVLMGAGGNDVLHGGDGNDTLIGGVGIDQLFGDAGDDNFDWDSDDSFDGGAGFDTLDANLSTSDTIDLRGSGFTTLERILMGSGADAVTVSLNKILSDTADHQFVADLGLGTDTLTIDVSGGWTAVTPDATLGPTGVAAGISVDGMTAHTFTDGSSTVTVFTNAEVIQQIPGGASLFTTGDDTVDFNQVLAGSYPVGSQYYALAGNDTVTLAVDAAAAAAAGFDPAQTFDAGDGDDVITGGTLNDLIYGGAGQDLLLGGDGNDTLTGGSSSDRLEGGAGNDVLNGGGSADTLIGGLGDDILDGGGSSDTADYSGSAMAVVADLVAGTATGEGNDTLLNIERLIGSAQDDTFTGDGAKNILSGGGGNDVLHGGDGDDTLTGDAGLDQLFGDAGHDTLTWDGADYFDGGAGFDTLDANLSSSDSIDLRGANFVNLERIRTGSGKDIVTLSLNDVLSDTADHQFVADLGSSSPDTLNIDTGGGWTATASNSTLGPTGVAAGISVSGMTAYTFTNGADTVTVFSNAEVVNAEILSS